MNYRLSKQLLFDYKLEKDDILFIGFEFTFDNFSVAIVNNNLKVLYMLTYTISATVWKRFGGIVPIIAINEANKGMNNIIKQIEKKLKNNINQVKHIFFSDFHGINGCLSIGKEFVEKFSNKYNLEATAINHLEAHFFAAFLNKKFERKDFLYFVFSGGNSKCYIVNTKFDFSLISETRDLALGDMLDKLARLIGFLNAVEMDEKKQFINFEINLPDVTFKRGNNLDFSFSGWECFLVNFIKNDINFNKYQLGYVILYSVFKKISLLIRKIAQKHSIIDIVIGGGVSANLLFREILSEISLNFIFSEVVFSTDNGAMIASSGILKLKYDK